MLKRYLSLLRFSAPADNGSGGAAQASAAPAPAASGDTQAPAGISLADLARSFSKELPEDAPVAPDAKDTPAAPAADASTPGSDSQDDGAAAPAADDTAADAAPDAEDVKPPEGVTPERQAEYQKGIDKLKARRKEAEDKAAALEAQLAEAQKKLADAAAPPADPAKARANLPPVADPLFLATSENEIADIADSIDDGLALGTRLLENLDASGDDEITVGRETFTRARLKSEIAGLQARQRLVRRAGPHLSQRRTSDAEAARLYPDLFPAGKPKPEVDAVLTEIPELQARANGRVLAAEIAAARAARAKVIAKPAAAAPASPTPGKPAAKPPSVPGAVAAPAAIAPSQSAPQNPPLPFPSGKGFSVHDLARDYGRAG